MDIPRLAALTPLSLLSIEQVGQLAPYAAELRVPRGDRVLLSGPMHSDLVVVESGRGVVRHAGEQLAELGPGDVFGGLAVLRFAWPTATVTARTDLALVTFSGGVCRVPDPLAVLLETMDKRGGVPTGRLLDRGFAPSAAVFA
ncbi:MAG: cyclic nucleotide-binding domain-containing protein [Actinomycetota bacterium]|nr:cyclic nucleotide-binding domain-containing protein [Actinomycetota bacterium]